MAPTNRCLRLTGRITRLSMRKWHPCLGIGAKPKKQKSLRERLNQATKEEGK